MKKREDEREPTKASEEKLTASRANIKWRAKLGAVAAIFIAIIGYFFVPFPVPPMPTIGERLAFTLRWQLPSLTMLLAGIIKTARTRDRSAAMNPTLGVESETLSVHTRYIQNTLEQLVLSTGGQLVLTGFLDQSDMKIIPVLVILFCIGRIAFWIGYMDPTLHRTNRATGVAMTFMPALVTFAYCWYQFVKSFL